MTDYSKPTPSITDDQRVLTIPTAALRAVMPILKEAKRKHRSLERVSIQRDGESSALVVTDAVIAAFVELPGIVVPRDVRLSLWQVQAVLSMSTDVVKIEYVGEDHVRLHAGDLSIDVIENKYDAPWPDVARVERNSVIRSTKRAAHITLGAEVVSRLSAITRYVGLPGITFVAGPNEKCAVLWSTCSPDRRVRGVVMPVNPMHAPECWSSPVAAAIAEMIGAKP